MKHWETKVIYWESKDDRSNESLEAVANEFTKTGWQLVAVTESTAVPTSTIRMFLTKEIIK